MNRARAFGILVNASAHFCAAQGDDDPLDLPPVAEANDIAVITASLGPNRGLETGVIAEALDQLGGIGERRPSGYEGRVHAAALPLLRFRIADKHRQQIVDHRIIIGARPSSLWRGSPGSAIHFSMQPSNKRAGGFFLMAAILVGFAAGVYTGNAMAGVWSGLAVGIVAAVVTWLLDRKNG